MKHIAYLALLAVSAAYGACPDGNYTPIDPNKVGAGKMPYEITLDYTYPHASFFRINPYHNAEVFRFDIGTDKGKQIYSLLLASKAQCRTLTLYTGNYRSDAQGNWTEIKKIVLE